MLKNRKGSQLLSIALIVMLCIAVAISAITVLFFIMVKGEQVEHIQQVEGAEITVASGLNILLGGEIDTGGQTVSEFIEESAKALAGSQSAYDTEICNPILEMRYGAERYYFSVAAGSSYIECGTDPLLEDRTISSVVAYLPALDASGNKIRVVILLRTW